MTDRRGDETGELNDVVWSTGVKGAAGGSKRRRFTAQPPPASIQAPAPTPPVLIPDEVIDEILSRVPVKALIRFQCVCKSWKSIISDPQFAKSHLLRSSSDPDFTHHRLAPQACFLRDNVVSCSVRSLYNSPLTIPESFGYPLKPKYDIIGYCNGLLCLVCDGKTESRKRFRLWNPCTRLRSQKSPILFNRHGFLGRFKIKTVFGFGYDRLSNTYKVLSVFCDGTPKPSAKVFTFGTFSWREIQNFHAIPYEWKKSGEFVSGTLNWLATHCSDFVDPRAPVTSDQHVILSFDLGRETCRELLLPDDRDKNICVATTLGVLRDFLCVSQNYEFTCFVVWQMMQYGVNESWTRLLSISYMDLGMRTYAYLDPLCMSEDGNVLMTTNLPECKVVLHNPRDNRLERHEIQSNKSWFRSTVFVESLVSPYC